MNRTQRSEIGLRPALSPRETQSGQLARTFPDLDDRVLSALHEEMAFPFLSVHVRTEDALDGAFLRATLRAIAASLRQADCPWCGSDPSHITTSGVCDA